MKLKNYTHIPVYENGVYKWVVTESSIVYSLTDYSDEQGDIIAELITVKDVLLENNNDKIWFTDPRTSIYDVIDKFEQSIKNQERLWAILITENGKIDWKLYGIITAWDLPNIEKDL